MSIPGGADALADIHATFAEPVIFTGAGLTGESLPAVETDDSLAEFAGSGIHGSGEGLRRKFFEVRDAALAEAGATGDPAKDDLIVDGAGGRWRVIEPVHRDDVAAWVLTVEEDS